MRGVKKAIFMVGESEGGKRDEDGGRKERSDTSAIARISRGREDVPESVGEYSLEMNSRINIRWTDEEEGTGVECSRTGSGWQVEVHREGNTFVVSEHSSFDDALGAAETLMSGEDTVDGVPPEFEEEVERVLESIDTESMETIEEVGDAFGD